MAGQHLPRRSMLAHYLPVWLWTLSIPIDFPPHSDLPIVLFPLHYSILYFHIIWVSQCLKNSASNLFCFPMSSILNTNSTDMFAKSLLSKSVVVKRKYSGARLSWLQSWGLSVISSDGLGQIILTPLCLKCLICTIRITVSIYRPHSKVASHAVWLCVAKSPSPWLSSLIKGKGKHL